METVEIAAIAIVALLSVLGWVLKRIMANTSETRDIVIEMKVDRAEDRKDIAALKDGYRDHEGRIRHLEHPRVRTHPTLQGETRYP